MALDEEIQAARKTISTDGYDMSVGELMSLYEKKELVINPEYQRFFRWEESQKTSFIESLLLGIPIPPIFVYQTEKGLWELVDGLQRLSTVFEFSGILRSPEDQPTPPSILDGTKQLPSLKDKVWQGTTETDQNTLAPAQKLFIKRARIHVEILKQESHPHAKYELFKRLNTGGSYLKPQEVRNAILVMVSPGLHRWIKSLTEIESYSATVRLSDAAELQQAVIEWAIRFLVYRHRPYSPGLDVHEYIDTTLLEIATDPNYDRAEAEHIFRATFDLLYQACGADVFKRWDGTRFAGRVALSAYEPIVSGVAANLESILELPDRGVAFVCKQVKALWDDPEFTRNSGAGVRGTTRLAKLLPLSVQLFRP